MKISFSNATYDDVEYIFKIIQEYSSKGIILGREKEDILDSIHTFRVAKINNSIAGIISYYDYDQNLKEIRSLIVKKSLQNSGIGAQLVTLLVEYLQNSFNNVRIFVLTYLPAFFEKQGFEIIEKDLLPEKIWKDCQNCKSKDNCQEIALILNYKAI